MTTTYTNMIDEALLNLSGYTMRQDRSTHLTQEINASALTLNLADVSNIGKGVVEIDDELLWIDSYDRVSNTATVAPYGRGYNGTTAAEHTTNSRVTVAPTFPKAVVKKAINDTIDAVFPQLFATGVTVFNFNSAKTTYSLPAEAETILYVSWQPTGSTEEWMPLRNWRQDPLANTTSFASGNSISVYDNIQSGRKIQVHYTKKSATFQELATPVLTKAQVFETVTGLPASCKDVILYGASYRLASFIDPGRLNYSSAEADNADTKIQYGSGASTARFMLGLYQQRLNEEAGKLRDVYPTRIHYTRY